MESNEKKESRILRSIEADQIEEDAKLALQFMGLQVQKYAYNHFHIV